MLVRQAFGSQIRAGLETEVAEGRLDSWQMSCDDRDGLRYVLVQRVTPSLVGTTVPLTPGEVAEWLNARGHNVRFGATR